MTTRHPYYMRPETARALLAQSRHAVARLRTAKILQPELERCGWSPESARELAHLKFDLTVPAPAQPIEHTQP